MSIDSQKKKTGIITKLKSFFTIQPITGLTPLEFADLAQSGQPYQLLDVREPYEVKLSYIPGSIHVPLRTLNHNILVLVQNGKLDPDVPTVVYCKSGARSKAAIQKIQLMDLGFKALYNLDGGINAYSNFDSSIRKY